MNKLKLCLIVSIIFNIILIFSNKKNVVRPMNNFNVLLTDILNCTNKNSKPKVSQKNGFYVLYNFIEGDVKVDYEETITLTAPADVRFLNNIVPLAIRWQAPMSIAVYTPGHDFYTALKVIAYLRSCTTPEIRQFVTFHLFFDEGHLPNSKKPLLEAYEDEYDCNDKDPTKTIEGDKLYKQQNDLLFPINVARNIAREAARTYLVFPSDIELFPTPNFVNKFMDFIRKEPSLIWGNRNVFVLPLFEMKQGLEMPSNKSELIDMIKNKKAFWFHQGICESCHRVIDGTKWLSNAERDEITVFASGKRQGKQVIWEPFFICTNNEPLWDERMTWEGQANKMSQVFSLCLQDYTFNVLDNAFLMHKPGIKGKKLQNVKYMNVTRRSMKLLKGVISPELKKIYGNREGCRIM